MALTTDALGNHESYRGLNLTWTRGRLLQGLSDTAGTSMSFKYDENGNRYEKALRTSAGAVTTTRYFLDGDFIVAEDRGGTLIQYYYNQTGVIGMRYGGVDYIFVKDALGSITEIMNASGMIYAQYAYDAWGNTTVTPIGDHTIDGVSIADFNRIRYKSQYQDESGLYYMGGRYYSPITRQYLSPANPESAMASAATIYGLNLYLLTLTNPISMGYNGYTIATNSQLAYDPDALTGWQHFWGITCPQFWGSNWGKGLAIGLFALVTIATIGASLVFKAAAAAIWIAYAKTMVLSAACFFAGAAIAGLSSISMGNGYWDGFVDYINNSWSQALALTSILYGVQLGLIISKLAVARAATKAALEAELIRAMNNPLYKESKGLDCSEIAEDLAKIAGGKGKIMHVTAKEGQGFTTLEYGRLVNPNYYHDVFVFNGKIFDPRFALSPIMQSTYISAMKGFNPIELFFVFL